jgi:hypothetical protein
MTRISMARADYPKELLEALAALEARQGRTDGLGPEAIRRITDPLGQLLFIARREGREVAFNLETLAAYIRDLDSRGVKNTTRLTYVKGLRRLALALKWRREVMTKIDAEITFYRKASFAEVPEKERKLLLQPITLRDVGDAAKRWFDVAEATKNLTRRRSNFHRAAFLAFTSLAPNRVGDIQHLLIDKDIFRTRSGWFLSTESRKTCYEQSAPLHANLTPYLDALVHVGEPDRFEKMLRARSLTPLFCKKDGSMLLRETLWRHFRIATRGHSPHIVRTLTHDFLATDDDPQSAMIARVLCGQKSLSVGADYEVFAKRARFQRAQLALSRIQAEALAV